MNMSELGSTAQTTFARDDWPRATFRMQNFRRLRDNSLQYQYVTAILLSMLLPSVDLNGMSSKYSDIGDVADLRLSSAIQR